MIATGGLLRMNRRQDSIRSKNRAENKRKRKAEKRRKKNDVVVVKGKLNLCSPAGLVAAMGVVVLMVGIAMAVLGYWPIHNNNNNNNNQARSELRLPGGQTNGKMSYSKSPARSPEWPDNKTLEQRGLAGLGRGNGSGSELPSSSGFLRDFLDSYLYSDNLKVFGPLVMGIGIFLFICANAVLHENRDKKTKIINLRDIYSTVIDLHSARTKDYSPINGLVNYSQTSRAAEAACASGAARALSRGSWPSTAFGHQGEPAGSDEAFRRPSLACRPRSWSREVQTFTDTVYSIYRDHARSSEETPRPKEWETTSIVASSVNAFTLPVIKLNNCEVEETERTEAVGLAEEEEGEEGEVEDDGGGGKAVTGDEAEQTDAGSSGSSRASADTKDAARSLADSPRGRREAATAEQQGAPKAPPQWTNKPQLLHPSPVARATGSRLSLNSLSDQPRSARRYSLSVSACRQGDRARRFSCPRLERSNSKGYIKLTDLGGESFEAPDADASPAAAGQEVATAAAAVVRGEEALITPSTSAEH